jgi:pimeloyl-ACP methyl ester carboxylesterase
MMSLGVALTSDDARLPAPDGTNVAYRVEGSGPAFVLSNGLTTTTTFWRYLQPRWVERQRVLMWDLPGHGASAPARSDEGACIAEQPEIIARLMDSVNMPSAVQIGWSTGCQVVLEMYRRYPQRCRALVLLLGAPGRVLDTAKLPLPGRVIDGLVRHMPPAAFGGLARVLAVAANAPLAHFVPRRLGLIGAATTARDATAITEHLLRIDTATVQRMVASAQAHSGWEVLPEIDVPVLVIAGDRDPFAPAETVGAQVHARCPGAELLRLPEGTHTALLDHADVIGDAVDDFIRRRVAASA